MDQPADDQLLQSSYEALSAIYAACEDRAALPDELQHALEFHQPLLGALTDRVAP
jgi:hypothetical protein